MDNAITLLAVCVLIGGAMVLWGGR